jgi:hypothetical protein
MSYQEKRTITGIVSGVAVLAAYCLYAFGKAGPAATAPEDLKAWAVAMLIFIGAGIAAMIVIQIVFHILLSISIAVKKAAKGEKEIERAINADIVEDERDRLIGLKSSKISLGFGGAGFIAGLLFLAFGFSPVLMLNVMFLAFCAGSIAEGVAQLVLYRKGVKNG